MKSKRTRIRIRIKGIRRRGRKIGRRGNRMEEQIERITRERWN